MTDYVATGCSGKPYPSKTDDVPNGLCKWSFAFSDSAKIVSNFIRFGRVSFPQFRKFDDHFSSFL